MTTIRSVARSDAAEWLRMRNAFWPDHESRWHASEIEQFFAGKLREPLAVLVAAEPSGALVQAAEEWGRAQGCTEFGSDALIDNDVSAAAHQALGFRDTARIRCFLKPIAPVAG